MKHGADWPMGVRAAGRSAADSGVLGTGAQTHAGLQGDSKAGKAADAFGAGLLGGVCADSGGRRLGSLLPIYGIAAWHESGWHDGRGGSVLPAQRRYGSIWYKLADVF